MRTLRGALPSIVGLFLALAASGEERPWTLPEPGSCAVRASATEDAQPPHAAAPAEGDVVAFDELAVLKRYLPAEVWEWRNRFFHQAMRLELGPCFRS